MYVEVSGDCGVGTYLWSYEVRRIKKLSNNGSSHTPSALIGAAQPYGFNYFKVISNSFWLPFAPHCRFLSLPPALRWVGNLYGLIIPLEMRTVWPFPLDTFQAPLSTWWNPRGPVKNFLSSTSPTLFGLLRSTKKREKKRNKKISFSRSGPQLNTTSKAIHGATGGEESGREGEANVQTVKCVGPRI